MGSLDTEHPFDRSPPAFAGETCNHFFLVADITLASSVWITFTWREVTDVFLDVFTQGELIVTFADTAKRTHEIKYLSMLLRLLWHVRSFP